MSNIQFVKIKELCSYNNVKKEVQSLLNDDGQVSFLPMADLEEFGYYSLPKQDRALFEVYKSYTYFKENDLLIAKITPCFENGKMGIAKNLTNMVGFGSSEYHVLTPNKKISVEYLYYFFCQGFIRERGIKHLLIDQPSVDREHDEGKLLAHKAFWNYSIKERLDATITELIYAPDSIPDGYYLLNLQIAPFENDASPSKPILDRFL